METCSSSAGVLSIKHNRSCDSSPDMTYHNGGLHYLKSGYNVSLIKTGKDEETFFYLLLFMEHLTISNMSSHLKDLLFPYFHLPECISFQQDK